MGQADRQGVVTPRRRGEAAPQGTGAEPPRAPASPLGRAWASGRLPSALQVVGTLVGVVLLWELVVKVFHVADYLLPPPSAVFADMREYRSLLVQHSLVTLYEVVIGFGAALAGGVVLGVLIGSVRLFERMATPIILFFQVVPKSAIAPLLIVWVGVGTASKIALVFLMSFFPILVQMVAGMRSVSREIQLMVRSTGASRWSVLRRIQIPHSLPYLFAGMRVSITLAVVGAIVAEFIASSSGIGYLLLIAFGRLDTSLVLAGLMSITIEAMLLYWLVLILERLLIPWHVSQRMDVA